MKTIRIMDFGGCDILKLRDLLEQQTLSTTADSDSDDDSNKKKPYDKITTASSANLAKIKCKDKPAAADLNSKPPPFKKPLNRDVPYGDGKDEYDPFDAEAFDKWEKKQEELELEKLKVDSRKEPEHEIIYKQQVATEDVYLQMGNKTPGSSSCECIAIKVKLPKTNSSDIQLDVQTQMLNLETKDYLLHLALPHAVHPQKGTAQWDEALETLTVTLFLDREYDFINF